MPHKFHSLSVFAGITGSLSGSATSSSYAITAQTTIGSSLSSSYATTSSYAVSSSHAPLILPSGVVSSSLQINTGSFTGSFTGSLQGSASYALSASWAPGGQAADWNTLLNKPAGVVSSSAQVNTGSFTGSFTGSVLGAASSATSASYALTASYIDGRIDFPNGLIVTGSVVATAGFTGSLSGSITSASYASTASLLLGSIQSASFATTASFASTLDGYAFFPAGLTVTGSLLVSSSITGSLLGTSSYAVTASYVAGAASDWNTLTGKPAGLVSSSAQINTGSFTGSFTGSVLGSSSYATTSSYASLAQNVLGSITSASFATTASFASTLDGYVAFPDGLTITGSLYVSGSSITGSLLGTSSWSTSASWAPGGASDWNSLSNIPTGIVSNSIQTVANINTQTITPTSITASTEFLTTELGVGSSNFGTSIRETVLVSGSTQTLIGAYASIDNYAQFQIRNTLRGSTASADLIVSNDSGSETFNYIDIGINSSNYSNNYVGTANDGYVYSISPGELHIGNAATGSTSNIRLFAGGANSLINTKLYISSSGFVGIGATNPISDEQLYVGGSGSIRAAGAITASSYRVVGTGSNNGFISFDARDSAPAAAPAGFGRLYVRDVAGRVTPSFIGPSGTPYQIQTALYNNNIQIISPNNTTTFTTLGNGATSAGTVSHPTTSGDRLPWMSNLATGAGASGTIVTASVSTTNVANSRGTSITGSGGFLFVTRLAFPDNFYTGSSPDPSGSMQIFVGLSNATMLGVSANPSTSIGVGCGFQLFMSNGDTTWSFVARDGTNLTRQTTGVGFNASQSMYDFYIFSPVSGSYISWRIDDIFNTKQIVSGTMSGTLPTPGIKLRGGWDMRGRGHTFNIRQERIYIESDL